MSAPEPGSPVCVFRVDRSLLETLEAALGPPIDSYLNGWQVWIEPAELHPGDDPVEFEYRLHPPHGFRQPEGLSHHDLWDAVVEQLADGADRLMLGREHRTLPQLWVLLEVYPAFGERHTPGDVGAVAERMLGRAPLACGYVDHARLGSIWKRHKGGVDLPGALLAELGVHGAPDTPGHAAGSRRDVGQAPERPR
ncbi:MAG TPA: hypothetical protein VHF25_02350 [Nitriliruptorales bacterium]|nr:hypothetical protein [Nitriliruptorales bacterium]